MTRATLESRLFCEGYHDRDFLDACLPKLGWSSAQHDQDPEGSEIRGEGQRYYARGARHLRVVPLTNDDAVFRSLTSPAIDRPWIDRVVACVDSDEAHDHADPVSARRDQFQAATKGADRYRLLVWHTTEHVERIGVPSQHTLERIVCSGLVAAYPERAEVVSSYVMGHSTSAKAWSWANMARWYPKTGCSGFFKKVWAEPKVASEMLSLMEAAGLRTVLDGL